MQYTIIGCGTGTIKTLTEEARHAILQAKTVLGTQRICSNLHALRPDILPVPFHEMVREAVNCPEDCAILLSGDVGFFSAAQTLGEQLAPSGTVRFLPGISSLSALCAKVGEAYESIPVFSVHGRVSESFIGAVCYQSRIFLLTGGLLKVHDVCCALAHAGLGNVHVVVGDNLDAPDERVIQGAAEELQTQKFSDLCVMLIKNKHAQNAQIPLYDADFERGKVPMTKQEVRWCVLNMLNVKKQDVVWDIGAGTGSVSCALARLAQLGTVYAVERGEEAIGLLSHNRNKLGAYNMKVIFSDILDCLSTLPTPDCVFIGGASGVIGEVVKRALELNPLARFVITAVSLETVQEAMNTLKKYCDKYDCVCLQTSRSSDRGQHTLMIANNPVYIFSGKGGQ